MSEWFPIPQWTTISFVVGVVLVLATAAFSWITVVRSGFSRSMIFLESLRVLLVALVAYTLNQPEIIQTYLPEERPSLVVLWDESNSMNTQDMTDEESADSLTRLQWIEQILGDDVWDPYSDKVNVVIKSFSSDLGLTNSSTESKTEIDQKSAAEAQSEYSRRATDINSPLNQILEDIDNLRGVVLLSDGSWNLGKSPTQAASQLRMRNIPVYAVTVGDDKAQPDLEVLSLDAPTSAVVDKSTHIPFRVRSTLPEDVDAVVSLISSDGDSMNMNVRLPANETFSDAFIWTPQKIGDYELILNVPKHQSERNIANNELTVPITVSKESIKVLVVESFPRWEFRYIRNALARDPGVDVKCLLFHPGMSKVGGGKHYIEEFPPTREELSQFDVIFLGDVGVGEKQLTVEDCELIKGLVENQASGVIFMPGFRGNQFSFMETELEDLYPVALDPSQARGNGTELPGQFQLTVPGADSLLTKLADTPQANETVWRSLPGFQWYAPIVRAKAGTQTLAVHHSARNEYGRIPLLVSKTYGSGKALFMGTDGVWRWRKGVEDKYHYRFWAQVARWMAYRRGKNTSESMKFFCLKERYKVGDVVSMNAIVSSSISGEPLQNGTVTVRIEAPSRKTVNVTLAPQNGAEQWGLYSGQFSPTEPGTHKVVVLCDETGEAIESTIDVIDARREKIGQPANFEVMDEIANISRGKSVQASNIEEVFDAISNLPDPEPLTKRFRLWANPWWAGMLIVLMGVFWTGRKLIGKV